jgi:phospholipid/cholesterol/gamma-HCH transport system ATP-binding protein
LSDQPPPAETVDDAPADAPIVVRHLMNAFGDRTIHEDLNLTLDKGEVLGVVGGSGTGKTVLLNCIIGLRNPDAGEVRVFGKHLAEATDEDMSEIEKRWGVLFQQGALFSSLTVRENVSAPLIEHTEMGGDLADDIAELKIALVGLPPEAADLKPAELSGGMRKRVGLARALALDPELLFLDEPTAGLDPIGAAAFDELIRSLATNLGLSVFMVTHDLDSLYTVCDRVAVLADKHVVAHAPLAELEKSSHPWIREYFLGPRGRAARGAH